MPVQDSKAELLVEGKNDKHVVWSLCEQHQVPQTFDVKDVGDDAKVLESIPVRLKAARLRALGIVLDADQSVARRWQAVCGRLQQAGYLHLPVAPSPQGSIIQMEGKPRIGVWLMPDNQTPGMLEHFVSYLIPKGDDLAPWAKGVLEAIEKEGLNRYSLPSRHQKAFIHTWLAWQETPGQPMGQAITAQVLNSHNDIVQSFVNWLNLLFNQ